MSGGYTKSEVEAAILAALFPLSVGGGGNVRILETYKGEFSAAGVMPEALQTPSIFLAYASSTFRPGPYLYVEETMSFNVIAACRSGGPSDALEVLTGVRDRLCGSTLGLDVSPIRLLRVSSLYSDREMELYAALYTLTQKVRPALQG